MDFEGEHAGKVAVVLGGSRGIGAAIVERLAMDGARVLFTYAASPDRAEDIVARLRGQSCDVVAVRADSGDAGQVEAAIDHAVQRFGRLDVLVVNAGILRNASIDQYSLEDFDRMVAVNIRGVFAALRHAASLMADGGRIITIGSNIAARIGFPKASIYAMTKAAVAAMVKGAAIDLGSRGITVNNIQPGPTDTELTAGHHDLILPLVPLGRMGRPTEIAGLVAYLVRGEAGFITGASLTIDGGVSL
jgi:3-oxoacyl-[acyl-carrier protein] reductase